MTATALLHPFEGANLGLAPFRCVGMETRRHPQSGQPWGTCNYCGTGIADCYRIASADGKEFVVGSDCVMRTYLEVGTAVPLDIRRAIAAAAREKRDAVRVKKLAALRVRVAAAREQLERRGGLFANEPHPNDYFAGQGKTRRDYVLFMLGGSQTGRALACREIEKAVASEAPTP